MLDSWLILLQSLPFIFLTGLTSSTIGFTAWSIVVPLLYVGAGYPVYDSIMISLLVDVANCSALTLIYSRKGKVDFKKGAIYLIPVFAGAIIGLFIGSKILMDNQEMLRGGAGWLFLVIGVSFLFRARKLKKEYEESLEKKSESSEIPQTESYVSDDSNKNRTEIAKISIVILGCIFCGIYGGFVGAGNGTNFTLMFMIFFGVKKGFDTLKSTGTGCFMMLGLCTFVLIAILSKTDIVPNLITSLIFIPVSLIGVYIGSKFAIKSPEWKLNLLIGCATVISVGASMIQAKI